jgi:hypothetical protein
MNLKSGADGSTVSVSEWVMDHPSAMSIPDHSEKFPCKSKEAKFKRS